MRKYGKYELPTVLFVCALALLSSIVATVYEVYPFEEFQLESESEWEGFVTGDYYERHAHHATRH